MGDGAAEAEAGRWDARYAGEDYLFGREPNGFLARQAARIPDGAEVLCVADGEGRNGSWLAGRGLRVTAFDPSTVADRKARALDAERGVRVERVVCGVEGWDWEPDRWDAVAAIFIQFAPPDLRERIFAGVRRSLRPGGVLIMQGYGPGQLAFGTGGPGILEHLYTTELLREAFGDWEVLVLDAYDEEIREGPGHAGMSALVDLVARRPAG